MLYSVCYRRCVIQCALQKSYYTKCVTQGLLYRMCDRRCIIQCVLHRVCYVGCVMYSYHEFKFNSFFSALKERHAVIYFSSVTYEMIHMR